MKRVKSLIFSEFRIKEDKVELPSFLGDILSTYPYSNEIGFGFEGIEVEHNEISAKLLKRIPTFIQDYNEENNELTKRQIYLFQSINFSVDFNLNILIVKGGLSQLNTIKSIFRNIFNFEYQIDSINLNADSFLNILTTKEIQSSIQQITVKGFNYNNGFVGRFSGEVTRQEIGEDIINTYKSDIMKISFKIKSNKQDDESIILQIFPNGSIKFISDENDYPYYLNYIKTILFS